MKWWHHPKPPEHQHQWSKWRDAQMVVHAAGILSGYKVGQHFIGQTRRCETCGLREDIA